MRFTHKLNAQHLDWMFRKHWQVQGVRVPRDTGAKAELEKLGIKVKDSSEVISPKLVPNRMEFVGYKPLEVMEDESHPNWHNKVCHIFGNKNLLLEGIPQSQILTKTIEIKGFPKNIEETINKMKLSSSVDRSVQNSILASHVYDAEQVKMPKVKLIDRPAFNLPREYSISGSRRIRLLTNKLIFECEKLAGRSVTSRRKIIDNANFTVSLDKDDDLIQFNVSADTFITCIRPIEPVKGKYEGDIPDLFPIKHTITIPKKHVYTLKNFYSISKEVLCSHPHTILMHFNPEDVKNLHETSITPTQYQSRTMLKAFAVAAARAKQIYGESVKDLPKSIVVQSIQTDGRIFHFGVFQLNTLSLNGSNGNKNYWFHEPSFDLFSECGYKVGRPALEGYNKDVFRCFNAFYNNA